LIHKINIHSTLSQTFKKPGSQVTIKKVESIAPWENILKLLCVCVYFIHLFYVLEILGLELKALFLLGKHATNSSHSSLALFGLVIFLFIYLFIFF
jgi:hypothetical protein